MIVLNSYRENRDPREKWKQMFLPGSILSLQCCRSRMHFLKMKWNFFNAPIFCHFCHGKIRFSPLPLFMHQNNSMHTSIIIPYMCHTSLSEKGRCLQVEANSAAKSMCILEFPREQQYSCNVCLEHCCWYSCLMTKPEPVSLMSFKHLSSIPRMGAW